LKFECNVTFLYWFWRNQFHEICIQAPKVLSLGQ
jgi:hypothetical protein